MSQSHSLTYPSLPPLQKIEALVGWGKTTGVALSCAPAIPSRQWPVMLSQTKMKLESGSIFIPVAGCDCDVMIFESSLVQTAMSRRIFEELAAELPRARRLAVFAAFELAFSGLVNLITMLLRPLSLPPCLAFPRQGSTSQAQILSTPSSMLPTRIRSPAWEYCKSVVGFMNPFSSRSNLFAFVALRAGRRF